jgi:hypothetical protein
MMIEIVGLIKAQQTDTLMKCRLKVKISKIKYGKRNDGCKADALGHRADVCCGQTQ